MNESLNAGFNFDECPEFSKVRNYALHDIALVNSLAYCVPRIAGSLLDTQGNSVFFPVNANDLYGNFIALLEHVADLDVALPSKFS